MHRIFHYGTIFPCAQRIRSALTRTRSPFPLKQREERTLIAYHSIKISKPTSRRYSIAGVYFIGGTPHTGQIQYNKNNNSTNQQNEQSVRRVSW